MASTYPSKIDTTISLPTAIDDVTNFDASLINRLRDAILNIETELGTKPSGIYTTVKNRLDSLEVSLGGGFIAGGDLSGTSASQTVIGLQGHSISSQVPTSNQVLTFNGFSWAPATAASGFTAGGDLSGTSTSQTVTKIQNNTVSSGALTIGQVLTASTTSNWTATTLGGDVSPSISVPGTLTITNIALQGHAVKNASPSDGNVLTWVAGNTRWEPIAPTVISVSGTGVMHSVSSSISGSASLGTSNQVLTTNSGGTDITWSSDLSIASVTVSNFISGPGIAATAGDIRLQNTGAINARDPTNAYDISLFQLDSNNQLNLGDPNNTTLATSVLVNSPTI